MIPPFISHRKHRELDFFKGPKTFAGEKGRSCVVDSFCLRFPRTVVSVVPSLTDKRPVGQAGDGGENHDQRRIDQCFFRPDHAADDQHAG